MSESQDPKPQRDLEGGIVAHGKTFSFKGKDQINRTALEIIPWVGKLPQVIKFKTREFSAVCPFSGLPDISRLWVEYVPDRVLLELRSFKYYITSFREVGIYQEEATDLIAQDLRHILDPLWMEVRTRYNTRGGYDTTAVVEIGDRYRALVEPSVKLREMV